MAPDDPRQQDLIRKNARTGLAVLLAVAGMTGLAFASVPLYSMFCRVTGYGGTTRVSAQLPDHVLERSLTIRFNTDIGRGMPWVFKPESPAVDIKLGQRALVSFSAENKAHTAITGTALYNVTPAKVGKYFNKIQCFCFDEQILQPGEKVSMPVVFYVDPAMDSDPDMADVRTITLSYTFFRADSKELEDAVEGFYNE